MKLHSLLVPLALLPLVASAQSTVYSTNFSSGALRLTTGTAVGVADWVIASTKNVENASGASSTNPSYASGAFGFGIAGTTSGVIQTQSRFTSSPVTLTNINDYIQLRVQFTDTTNLLKSNGGTNPLNSTINVGLFDSGGVNPAAGLENSGLTATPNNTNFASGFAQNWEGYAARIGTTNGSSNINQIMSRPAQTLATASANQELLFMAVGGGTYGQVGVGVAGVTVGSSASAVAAGTLVNGTSYYLNYRITLAAADQYSISYMLLGSDGSTSLDAITGTTNGSSFISGLSFDGLAIGFRSAQSTSSPTASGTNIPVGITLNSVEVTNFSAIPEPSNFAALAGLAGLAAVGLRRKRKV